MKQRLHVVTLGVANLHEARRFYEKLGWKAAPQSNEAIVFFDLGCLVLGLFPRQSLAEDAAQAPDGHGFRGITLAHNVGSRMDVDEVFEKAIRSGARKVKEPQQANWGGYSGYFADIDGHLWEVAFNPFFPLSEEGYIKLPRE